MTKVGLTTAWAIIWVWWVIPTFTYSEAGSARTSNWLATFYVPDSNNDNDVRNTVIPSIITVARGYTVTLVVVLSSASQNFGIYRAFNNYLGGGDVDRDGPANVGALNIHCILPLKKYG